MYLKKGNCYFGKSIYQFQLDTKILIREIERILDTLYRHNIYLLLNETCLNELLLPHSQIYIFTNIYIYKYIYLYIYTHTHSQIYLYIYIYTFIYLSIYIYRERERCPYIYECSDSVMITIEGNVVGGLSLNPKRICLHSHIALKPFGYIVVRSRLFNLVMATGLKEEKL